MASSACLVATGCPLKEGRHSAEEDAKLQEYDWKEIKKHNTKEDLWVVLYNRVYNVTEHLKEGDVECGTAIMNLADQNLSEEFGNTLHTETARKMAKKYLIGKVKGEVLGDLFAEIDGGNNDDDGINWLVKRGVIFILVAFFLKILYEKFKKKSFIEKKVERK